MLLYSTVIACINVEACWCEVSILFVLEWLLWLLSLSCLAAWSTRSVGVPIGIQRPSKTKPGKTLRSLRERKVGKGRERCLKGAILVFHQWFQCNANRSNFEVLSSPGDLPDPPPDPGRLNVVTSGTWYFSLGCIDGIDLDWLWTSWTMKTSCNIRSDIMKFMKHSVRGIT